MKWFITLLISFASITVYPIESVDFNKKVLILHGALKIDENKKEVKITCNAYANRKAEGIKIKLTNSTNLDFYLDCLGGEVGSYWNLKVKKQNKDVSTLKYVSYYNGDAEDTWIAQSKLIDMNSDGFFDLVMQNHHIKQDQVSDKIVKNKKTYKKYIWVDKKNQFEEKLLSNQETKKVSSYF